MMKQKKTEIKKETPARKKPQVFFPFDGWMIVLPVVFAFVLYGNTISHDYALDDDIITRRNEYVQMGAKGIPKIFSKGFLYGFNRANDQSYRPVTLANIAIEKSLWGNNSKTHHFFNILWYALTGVLLFLLLRRMFRSFNPWFPLIVTLLFLAHPIHTEAIANIKSRDEILAFFFGILSLYLLLKYTETAKQKHIIFSVFAFFIAILSKESSITFIAVIPLFLYFFTSLKLNKIISLSVPFAGMVVFYLILRASILDSVTFNEQMIVINNSLMAAKTGSERLATTIYTLGKYVYLLFIPHPLSWDYSYKQIPVVNWGDVKAIGALLFYLAITAYAIIRFRKKDPVSFGILFYIITLSISSNLFIKIGSSMGERFLYTPSFGFAIAAGWLIALVSKADFSQKVTKNTKLLYAIAGIVLVAYSFKTITRNRVWKDNYTLFQSGVKTAPYSARAHQSLAYSYTEQAQLPSANMQSRKEFFDKAVTEYKKALEILPDYSEGWYNLGWCYYLSGNIAEAEKAYKKTLEADPKYSKAYNNLGVMSFDRKEYNQALTYFLKAAEVDPNYTDAWGNIGAAYHNMGNLPEAVKYYKKALEVNPNLSNIRGNLENAQRMMQGGQ